MKKKLLFIICVFIYVYFPISAVELRHSIGGEIAFYGFSPIVDDSYSLPSGLGAFYTLAKISKPSLFLSSHLYWYGFTPDSNYYTGSIMFIPTLALGYNFIVNFAHNAELNFSPYLSYGQYFRSIESTESILWFSRPVISSGLDIVINTDVKSVFSLGLFVSLILENEPFFTPGFRVKTGYSWTSNR